MLETAPAAARLNVEILFVVHGSVGRAHGRRGFVLVTMLLSMVALLAFVGLAIDVGYLQYQKTSMQTAADAAALGGVQELIMNGSGTLTTAAKADAALNGFTDGTNGVSVTVNNPPATGYYTTNSQAVEVIISQTVNTFFLELVGSATANVQVRAVAQQGPGSGCIYALDPAASGAFSVTNGATAQVSGCGVVVDSTSSSALKVNGNGRLNAASITVAGGASVSNGGTTSPAPSTNVAALPDPLAYITAPTVAAGCPNVNYNPGWVNHTLYINPGIYCGGITIGNGITVVFNPGIYILKGGGLSVGGGITVSGTGVTFYNTIATGYFFGTIQIGNGATVSLSAPTTGSLAGILFFQDRTVTNSPGIALNGGTNSILNGALYLPSSGLTCSNGATCVTGSYTIIVAKTIDFSGGVTVNADYSSLPAGSPVKGSASFCE
jgi:Flp pilus assembly protein TadG